MNKIVSCLLALLIVIILAVPSFAESVPSFPGAFWGSVTINGSPAPAGTRIEARGAGVETGISGNPLTTTQIGKYGDEGALSLKLIVQGEIADGAQISFLVNGVPAAETASWHSGQIFKLDITAVIESSGSAGGGGPSGGGGGNPPPTSTPALSPSPTPVPSLESTPSSGSIASFEINGIGEVSLPTDVSGAVSSDVQLVSADEMSTVSVLQGTLALDSAGSPVTEITCNAPKIIHTPDPGTNILQAYDLGPSGATFDPPIMISMKFDPTIDTNNLSLAFYDVGRGVWVPLSNIVIDYVNHVISGSTSHFTQFAVISAPEKLSISTSLPALTGVPAVAPGQTQEIPIKTSVPEPVKTSTYTPTPKQALPLNSSMITGLAIAIILIGLIVLIIVKRR